MNAKEQAKRIGNLLEDLALSLEEFRTGSEADRRILIEHLSAGYGDGFAYINQMIHLFEGGEATFQSFLRVTGPPILKRHKRN